MDLRRSIPAVLLLTLAVPPVQARSSAPSATESVYADSCESASTLNAESGRYRVRRRQAAGRESGLSAETVGLAGEYLACRSRGIYAGPESVAAWERFYVSSDAAIRRFAATFRSRGVNVEDCTQEVWADLMTSLPGFAMDPSRGRFTSWLFTIVRSKATNAIRRQARGTSLTLAAGIDPAADAAGPAELCQRRSDRDGVRRAMASLKDRASDLSYQVLHLRWIDRLSVAEVARTLGLSSGQVWAREHRMKRQLKAIFIAQGLGQPSGLS
jgi:RNA polymerase sigma factor (sigma-70 family)